MTGIIEYANEDCKIFFEGENSVHQAVACGEISLEYNIRNSPGVLKFNCLIDENCLINHGDVVSFQYKGNKMFLGYVFETRLSSKDVMSVLCYDQLRYLKNKGIISYYYKKYSEVVRMIGNSFKLNLGQIDDTGHIIGQRIENASLFDILGNAQDETERITGRKFVLFDDYGKLSLREWDKLVVPIVLDSTNVGSFEYIKSIDKDVFTKISVTRNNDYTDSNIVVAENIENQRKWGVLTHIQSEKSITPTQMHEIANRILKEHSQKKKTLVLGNCLGDCAVRGGSSLVVTLDIGNEKVDELMLVTSVKHKFKAGFHSMDLSLK